MTEADLWGDGVDFAVRRMMNGWFSNPEMWGTHGLPNERKIARLERDITALVRQAHQNHPTFPQAGDLKNLLHHELYGRDLDSDAAVKELAEVILLWLISRETATGQKGFSQSL